MLRVTGTRGTLEMLHPIIGDADQTTACRLSNEAGTREQIFPPSNSYLRMVAHFRRAARDASFALMPAEDGLAQAVVMEALAASGREGGTVKALGES